MERKGLVQFNHRDVTVVGNDIQPGEKAKEFTVTTLDWQEINGLESSRNKVRIISSVLSLETSVCDTETRRFNEEASALGDDVAILVISTDLPFTQARWCGAAGVERVMVLSDHAYVDFGTKYGCLLKEPRILRRAVFVVNRQDIVRYAAYMPELGQEPDYNEVLAQARRLVQESG